MQNDGLGNTTNGLRHLPQEPAVSKPILAPTDPRARPQTARQLPLQHQSGGYNLYLGTESEVREVGCKLRRAGRGGEAR